jgi:hypothetical protein
MVLMSQSQLRVDIVLLQFLSTPVHMPQLGTESQKAPLEHISGIRITLLQDLMMDRIITRQLRQTKGENRLTMNTKAARQIPIMVIKVVILKSLTLTAKRKDSKSTTMMVEVPETKLIVRKTTTCTKALVEVGDVETNHKYSKQYVGTSLGTLLSSASSLLRHHHAKYSRAIHKVSTD